jgi:P4 family phage/plasmid primase-like protien
MGEIEVLNISEPDEVADFFLSDLFVYKEKFLRLLRFNAQWFEWNNGYFSSVSDEVFRASLRTWLTNFDLKRYGRDGELVSTSCNIRVVNEVLDGILAKVMFSSDETSFFWIDEEKAICSPENLISFENGLLDIENGKLYKHTPNWFTERILPYPFDRKAKCPNWLSWMNSVSNGDKDWIDCLQLWFGYNLVGDTSKQRFAHFSGLPRSGKGTATRVLKEMLGSWNCASPTLTQIGKNQYTLQALMDKLAAIVPEASIGRDVDSKVVLETLAAIIGEDTIDIPRKYLGTLNGVKLKVRFTITSNEALKWPDPTNKLSSRCIVFPFNYSFAGKEDPEIEKRLLEELPGIANWAIDGLKRLRKGENLKEPKSGKEKHQLYKDLDSPINVFCRSCLKKTKARDLHSRRLIGVDMKDVQDAWIAWSKSEGRQTKGQTRTYIRSLIQNAFPEVLVRRRGKRGKQRLCYIGLKLTEEGKRFAYAAKRRGQAKTRLAREMKKK